MKKTSVVVNSILVLYISVNLFYSCKIENTKIENTKNEYLRKVLGNIDKIKYASYFSSNYASAPYDTLFIRSLSEQTEEYYNPNDTVIGESYVTTLHYEGKKTSMIYDGKADTYIDWQENRITIDSVKYKTSRSNTPQFYGKIKTIIKYALETHDSIIVDIKDFKDSVKFSLYIPRKTIEFYEKPYIMDDPSLKENEEFSRYDIWINRTNDLPFKLRRNMPHQTTLQIIKNVEFNKKKIEDFKALDYFPKDFAIGKQVPKKDDLLGKVAPDWVLKDLHNNTIALKDLKSKVLVIQFTGIGCGPCYASLPFVKELVNENRGKDFEFVCIETVVKNIDGIDRYYKNNGLNFKFLISTEELIKNYQAYAVPIFYVLDENRIIRKIVIGYSQEITNKKIRDLINELL